MLHISYFSSLRKIEGYWFPLSLFKISVVFHADNTFKNVTTASVQGQSASLQLIRSNMKHVLKNQYITQVNSTEPVTQETTSARQFKSAISAMYSVSYIRYQWLQWFSVCGQRTAEPCKDVSVRVHQSRSSLKQCKYKRFKVVRSDLSVSERPFRPRTH
jgi:hypothetical protein